MNLRNKILLIIGVTIIVISGLLYWHTATTWLISYQEIETETIQQDLTRLGYSLESLLYRIDITAHDWASWDDTYQFIIDHDPGFIETNLGKETFARLKINMILFVSDKGELVYGKVINLSSLEEEELPQGIEEYLKEGQLLYPPTTTEGYLSGLLSFQGKPMLIASPTNPHHC